MPLLAALFTPHPPLILPPVGRGEEKGIQATVDAMQECARRVAALKPDTIVVISPHATVYADYFHISPGKLAAGDFRRFSAPQVKIQVEYDEALRHLICQEAQKADLPVGVLGEVDAELDHGTMIPLFFIQQVYTDFRVVRMGFSGLSAETHAQYGQMMQKVFQQSPRNVVLLASGDLSHKLTVDGPYGFQEEGPQFDALVVAVIRENRLKELLTLPKPLCRRAAECGLRSLQMLAGCLEGLSVHSELLSYEGPFGVGYAVAWFELNRKEEVKHDPYVHLARQAVEHYVRYKASLPLPSDTPKELLTGKAATFVSLHRKGRLRGCIGTLEPWQENVAEEIIQNAVSACSRDPRFSPVRTDELQDLEISVDVLSVPEKIGSPGELQVKKYGVIVTSGHKRGVLLPDLHGVETVEEQVSIAMQKAGIRPGDTMQLQRFKVTRHV